MRLAVYGFPRRHPLGNLVNRGNRLIPKLTLQRNGHPAYCQPSYTLSYSRYPLFGEGGFRSNKNMVEMSRVGPISRP